MKVELTEKEAIEIFANRHAQEQGKKRYIPLIGFAIAMIICLMTYSEERQWISVILLLVLSAPALIYNVILLRSNGKYAKDLVENQK